MATRAAPTWVRESVWLSRFFVLLALVALAAALALLPLLWVAPAVLGILVVALTLIEPRWALFLLPFAVPFGSIREISIGPATVGGTEALLALFLGAWLARGVAQRQIRLERPPLWGPISLWYGWMALSLLWAVSFPDALKELIKWGEAFALYAVAAQELRRRDAALLVGATLLAGSLAAMQGIVQSLLRIGPVGFHFPLAGRIWLRAYGQFTQPNPYAGYIGTVLPLAYGIVAVGLGLGSAGQRPPTTALRASHVSRFLSTSSLVALAGGAGALLAAALFLSLSRGGWIGATAAGVAVGALLSRRAALASLFGGIVLALGFALGLATYLPRSITERATDFLPYVNVLNVNVRGVEINPTNFAVIERLAHWQAAYEMWGARPWLGQGVGNYAAAYPTYMIAPWKEPLGHAHNIYLNTLAETGLVGLGLYLLFWGSALWLVLRTVRQTHGLERGVAVGVLGALVHLHSHNFFDNLYVHGIYLHIALLLAVVATLRRAALDDQGFT